ncbi:MAG: transaldolase [Planctomycetota bacterium]|nr:MAG: transaldolase [Planctomycetota bacterium]REJ95310.1 MAG: transaldolase [Planctomycetota bacterium]REK24248.1 MAG: transaldolase [Planctomycetota bacterium]REK28767.1 MAG: transaldolase [Planctomycetota bacterium]
MQTPLESLVATGTKLWLDSVDPDAVRENREIGATGATSNPVIISDLIKTGRFDEQLSALLEEGLADEQVAWRMTDQLVKAAQEVFLPVWKETSGDDGYVSFELDPLLEAADCPLSTAERTARYIELAQTWSEGHQNRMIKVPATPGGLDALEEIVAAGVTPNITLIFSERQYRAARDAVWRGAQRRDDVRTLKSVYSIFISRIDVYTARDVPELSAEAQGQVGIVNAKRIWRENRDWWQDKDLPLKQEIIFASTGVKNKNDPPDKYVAALAGSDIQTNPPDTNAAIQKMEGKSFTSRVEEMPPENVLAEIDAKVDFERMEAVLMEEGLKKFADPQAALQSLIADKHAALAGKG